MTEQPPMTEQPLLRARDLGVVFPTDDGPLRAVDGVSFDVHAGEMVGVVGESGSGKSVTFLSVTGLLGPSAGVSGEVVYQGQVVDRGDARQLRMLRGREIAYVFQDPMTSLHPFFRIGRQLEDAVTSHGPVDEDPRERALELLNLVGIGGAEQRLRAYPHELSGGLRQRVLIALALAQRPKVLVADEPTTALDVTVQADVLELLDELRGELGIAVVLITHDLGVVATHCDRVMVMYAGRTVERAPLRELFREPLHPYTKGLLGSNVDHENPDERLVSIPGSPPSLSDVPSGCSFRSRCVFAMERCATTRPLLLPVDADHADACLLPIDDKRRLTWRTRTTDD